MFLSRGKHPALARTPRESCSAQPGQSSDCPNLSPHKKVFDFSVSFHRSRFGEYPPKHSLDQGSKGSIVQRAHDQGRRWSDPRDAITAFFLDRALAKSRALMHCPLTALFSRLPRSAVQLQLQCGQVTATGSVSCFTSQSITQIYVWCDHASNQSEVFQLQANDVTWLFRVHASQCTAHAQRFNVLKQRPRKWGFFFAKKLISLIVGVRSVLVRSYDHHLPKVFLWLNFTPDPQQVHTERFSLMSVAKQTRLPHKNPCTDIDRFYENALGHC